MKYITVVAKNLMRRCRKPGNTMARRFASTAVAMSWPGEDSFGSASRCTSN